jgi:short-subunit dehydrogenase
MNTFTSSRERKVVLLTGASAGLGLSLAKLLAPRNFRLILTAREASLPRLAELGFENSDHLWIRPLDVTSCGQRENIIEEARQRWNGVDILINNAGVAYRSVVEHFTEEGREEQMDVNFRAPMELIQMVLPRMREKHFGRIINVSSVSGMMAMPTMALYSASKFALEGATEALWYEVRPFNIKVTLVQPGFIHSESFKNTLLTRKSKKASEDPADPYYNEYRHMANFIARLMRASFSTPEKVAEKILHVMERSNPPLRVPATFDASLFAILRRLLPRDIYHRILYCGLPGVRCWGGAAEFEPASPRSAGM